METGPAEVRHAIRGTMNALKLCLSAFEMPLEASEKLEFLSDIDASADKLVSLLDEYEAHASSVTATIATSSTPPSLPGVPPAPAVAALKREA